MNIIMDIIQLKKKLKNEWYLEKVLKEDKFNQVTEAKPIVHSKYRDIVYDALLKIIKGVYVITLYTVKLPLKGMTYS